MQDRNLEPIASTGYSFFADSICTYSTFGMDRLDIISAAAKYATAILSTYILVLWGHRMLLHPLKSYPGPFLAKLTDAYAGYYVLRQTLHLTTWQNHVKYGPVLRHGPNRLVFNSVSALHDIYLSERSNKSSTYDLTRQASGTSNVWNTIDKNSHRRKRRLVGYGITERAMRLFEPTMTSQIDIFLQNIRSSEDQPVNIATSLKLLTVDIVSLLGFGYPLNTQTETKDRWMADGLVEGNMIINSFINFPALRYSRVDVIMEMLGGEGNAQYEELLSRMVNTRLAQKKDAQPDLFASIHGNGDLEGDITVPQSEIWQEAVFFIPAGADTVSAAISSLLFYLSSNPKIHAKLANEIRSAFTSGRDICGGPILNGCHYLRACIDEALRMSPPVAGTLWREPCGDEPLIVDGHVIPAGTQVGVCTYALHHNEEYFPDPFSYKPERWLTSGAADADGDIRRKRMHSAFVPFSLGSRSCPGKSMAYLEMSLVLGKLIWYFDIERAPGDQGQVGRRDVKVPSTGATAYEFALYDIFVSNYNGPYLVFKPRPTCEELASS
ncbi:hypothetical protein S40293_09889 [Stachybotrys chartarum IBT 40293]|nr:hypothetical protein S40293_09889 [Stachybotrys chartarum IBT 40293]KFA79681.1 hypothetical protein S40288_09080 [Stachybotrys chartarum IBT 40288]